MSVSVLDNPPKELVDAFDRVKSQTRKKLSDGLRRHGKKRGSMWASGYSAGLEGYVVGNDPYEYEKGEYLRGNQAAILDEAKRAKQ